MNIDQFKDFKFAGKGINKLMYGKNVLWERKKENPFLGKYMAINNTRDGSKVMVSDDLVTWSPVSGVINRHMSNDIRLCNGILVQYPNGKTPGIYYSDDYGITWKVTYPDGSTASTYDSVCCDDTYIYVLDWRGNIRYTKDMTKWDKLKTNIEINGGYSNIVYHKKYNLYLCLSHYNYGGEIGTSFYTTDINNPEWKSFTGYGYNVCINDDYCIYIDHCIAYIYDPSSKQFRQLSTDRTTDGTYIGLGDGLGGSNTGFEICNGYLYAFCGWKLKVPLNGYNNPWADWNLGTGSDSNILGRSIISIGNKIYTHIYINRQLVLYEYNTVNNSHRTYNIQSDISSVGRVLLMK